MLVTGCRLCVMCDCDGEQEQQLQTSQQGSCLPHLTWY